MRLVARPLLTITISRLSNMADFSTLKSQVAAVVRANGLQDIKGSNLQEQLFNIIDTMNASKVDVEAGKGLNQ